eukprot:1179212-Prorocentrum_minimum.AAC.4
MYRNTNLGFRKSDGGQPDITAHQPRDQNYSIPTMHPPNPLPVVKAPLQQTGFRWNTLPYIKFSRLGPIPIHLDSPIPLSSLETLIPTTGQVPDWVDTECVRVKPPSE